MAVARFYSGRVVQAKVMFAERINVWAEVRARSLGDNKFLLEFSTERSLNFALNGGEVMLLSLLNIMNSQGCLKW